MTSWRPQQFPFMEIIYDLTMLSSGQLNVYTKFKGAIYAAVPVAKNCSNYTAVECNGFSVNRVPPKVEVFVNCSGNDDAASGVLPGQVTQEFDLVVYGVV